MVDRQPAEDEETAAPPQPPPPPPPPPTSNQSSSSSSALSDLEESFGGQQTRAGYELGLEQGRKAGQHEGLERGLAEGAKLGSEMGFYKGFTMTWLHLLQATTTTTTPEAAEQLEESGCSNVAEEAKVNKILSKLQEVLELVDQFPTTNETFCEEKLANIRVKFRQSTSLLQVTTQ